MDQVTYLSDYTFMNCTSLTEFTLPPQVTSLYTQCFAGCTSLKTFNMNSTVNYVNNRVFEGCTSLESISLPRSCTSIYENAFKGCTSLVQIDLPDSCSSISRGAFSNCTALKEITLPEALTYINSNLFDGCTSLEKVTIPTKSSLSLYSESFLNCPSLKELTYNSNSIYFETHSIGYQRDENGEYIQNENPILCKGMFSYNLYDYVKDGIIDFEPADMTYHVIPETDTICIDYISNPDPEYCYIPYSIHGKLVTQLGNGMSAVMPQESSRSVYIPESVIEIADYAFLNCANLEYLSYYKSDEMKLTKIGLQVFYGTEMQRKAEESHSSIGFNKILYRVFSQNEQVKIEDYYTIIAADAFAHNAFCQEIILPDTITEIGDGAFYDCDALSSIVIPDSVTSIGTGAFVDCDSLEKVTLGSGLTEIGSDLFAGCDALKSINAPEGSKAAEMFNDKK